MTLLVFLAAAAGARIVAADFVALDDLLVRRGAAVSADELQCGQLLFLLSLEVSGEVLDSRLGGLLLLRAGVGRGFFDCLLFLFILFGGERQDRTFSGYREEEQLADG